MHHADNDHGIGGRSVIDGVRAKICDAQAGGQPLARGRGQRKVPDRLESRFDGGDKAGSNFL
jgi:hypothetical protein